MIDDPAQVYAEACRGSIRAATANGNAAVSQILSQNGRLYSDIADLNKRTDDIAARLSGVVERLKGPQPTEEGGAARLSEPLAILGQVNRANGRLQEIAALLGELEELV